MRYSKEHKSQVRQHLIDEGGAYVKERGLQGAGVDGIARSVGLTGAALYTHFKSKQDFLSAVLLEELVTTAQRFLQQQGTIEEALAHYLSLAHVRHAATGCALPALVADVPRGDEALRRSFEEGLHQIAEALAQKLEEPAQAMAVLASAVGGVALARALSDDAQAEAVLASTRGLILRGLGR